MTNKEYREKLDVIITYTSYDMLTSEELKELRRDMRSRKSHGESELPNSNGRASIMHTEHGVVLASYYTNVCMIDKDNNFVKLWDGWSKTTLKHVNEFRNIYGLTALNKREWVEMPIG